MGRRSAEWDLLLPPRLENEARHQWVCRSIRTAILDGRLRPGTRIPPTRELSQRYLLSRQTVVIAFEQLVGEGYLEAQTGRGTFVNTQLRQELAVRIEPKKAQSNSHKETNLISTRGQMLNSTPFRSGGEPARAFAPNLSAIDAFPQNLWMKTMARCGRRSDSSFLVDSDPLGYLPLRRAIAEHLALTRGVNCRSERIAILSSTQQSLDLAARLFTDVGDRVWVEDPCYHGARRVLEAAGVRIIASPVDADGLVVGKPESTAATPKMIYVTPSHQFPLGVTMSAARRLALLRFADRYRSIIFEDDYDGEFRYSGQPLPSLQGLDKTGTVIYAGSFSKTMFPSLRLSYLVLPERLIEAFSSAISITSRFTTLHSQATLAAFMEDGHFGRHLRSMRHLYAERQDVLLRMSEERLSRYLNIDRCDLGLQTVGWLKTGIDDVKASKYLKKHAIDVTPLSPFSITTRIRPGFLLGFAAINPNTIRKAAGQMARLLEEFTGGSSTSRR